MPPNAPLVAILRELVPTVGDRVAIRTRTAALAEAGSERSSVTYTETVVPILSASAELVVWSPAPLTPLALGWARAAAAHVATCLEATAERDRFHAERVANERTMLALGHELRSPLQGLVLTANLLLTRLRDTADDLPRAWLLARTEQLERSVRRLVRLSEDLLRTTVAGGAPAPRTHHDLGALVDEILTDAADDATWAGCRLVLTKVGDLDGEWNAFAVERVLSNLVANARKYAPETPITITVEGHDAHASITVSDQGPGIAPDDLPHVFERFRRGRNAGTVSGLGLGLWIVAGIARELGGTVDCRSTLGRGATFIVTLPRAPASDVSASSASAAVSPRPG